jgi:hypothetical protein|tara:strand:- start:362 stop:685 length:324 start_codon:yes stop_codon:yes gene_type:complete
VKKIIRKIRKLVAPNIQEIIFGRYLTGAEKSKGITVSSFNTASATPREEFLINHERFLYTGHFHLHYAEWRMRRIHKILQIFPLQYFDNKKILEVGGGHWNYWSIFC